MNLPTRLILFGFLCALAVLCGQLLPGCDARPAPAPLPRRERGALPDLAGEWVLLWAGGTYGMTLSPDGSYEARGFGTVWRGVWSLRGRTLCVLESPGGPSWQRWEVRLDARLCGVAGGGRRVELRRVR